VSIRSTARVFWHVLRANPLTLVGFVMVTLICAVAGVMAVAPSLLVHYGPRETSPDTYASPSWAHPLGTDNIGLDLYSEVMRALPLDLGIALVIVGVSVIVGGFLGLVAGYWDRPGTVGAAVSVVILRVTDVFLAFPSLLLALAITISLGRGPLQVVLAVLVTWWPFYVRLVRGETLAVKHLPYIQAARAAGVPEGRIVLRHVVRNILEPIVVYLTMDIGTVLVVFSTIAFVAAAISYPSNTPEWGSILSYYQQILPIASYPWLVLAPGAAIFVTVLAFSLLGDGLRDILDPRTRRTLASAGAGTRTPPEGPPSVPLPAAAVLPAEGPAPA
jgi:peptide/nickel transport system permease protein